MQGKSCLEQLQSCRNTHRWSAEGDEKGESSLYPLKSKREKKLHTPKLYHIKVNSKVISISIIRKEKKIQTHLW